MDNRNFLLIIGWFFIVGVTLLIAAIVFSSEATIRLLITVGFLLLLAAFILPFVFESEE